MAKRIIIKKIHVNLQINFESAMKKRIYLLLLSVIVIFSSCKDKTNEFAEPLFTNEQITMALRECITITSDNTLNTLCIADTTEQKTLGFNHYELGTYRIELLDAASAVADTLMKHNESYKDTIEKFIFNVNRAAERCGNNLKAQFLNPLIKNFGFPNPSAVLRGGNTAVTDYVKKTTQSDFVASLISYSLVVQFDTLKITPDWNRYQEEYRKITGVHPSINILNHCAPQFVNQFFKKMALEEVAVRKNPGAYSSTTGIFYRVFSTL